MSIRAVYSLRMLSVVFTVFILLMLMVVAGLGVLNKTGSNALIVPLLFIGAGIIGLRSQVRGLVRDEAIVYKLEKEEDQATIKVISRAMLLDMHELILTSIVALLISIDTVLMTKGTLAEEILKNITCGLGVATFVYILISQCYQCKYDYKEYVQLEIEG